MAEAPLQVDLSELQGALVQYKIATGKTWPEVLNRAMRNLALRTTERLPRGDVSAITALKEKPWWPKYVAKTIAGPGYGVSSKRKGVVTNRIYQGRYTRAEARRVSARMIARRKASVGLMKSGFAKAGKVFGGRAGRREAGMERSRAWGALARAFRLLADMTVEYDARSGADAAGKHRIAAAGLRAGVAFVTQDMRTYAEAKLAKAGRDIST